MTRVGVSTKRFVAMVVGVSLALLGASVAHAETRADLVLSAGETLAVPFDQRPGYVACPDPPVTVTNGPVALGGAALSLSLTRPPGAAYTCVLVDNRGAGAVSGTFAGLPEGAVFGPPHGRFRISYAGGDGNDIWLTRVEVPPTFHLTFDVDVYPNREFFDDRPITGHVYITGDTETTLAASGTVTIAVDGATVGTQSLVHASANFSLGSVPVGEHTLTIAYSGATYNGRVDYLADTFTYPFTIRHRWGSFPTNPPPPGPVTPPGTSVSPSPSPTSAPGAASTMAATEPPAATLRAALRTIHDPVIARRGVTFSQELPVSGTVRWRVLSRAQGAGRVLAVQSRPMTAGRVRARVALGRRAWRRVTSRPREHLLLETRLTTATGRTITARARLR